MRPGVTSALFAILKLGRPARERHPNQKSKQETSINTARKWLTSENHYDYNRRSRGRHRHHYPDPLAPQTLPAVPAAPAAEARTPGSMGKCCMVVGCPWRDPQEQVTLQTALSWDLAFWFFKLESK